MTRTLFVSVRTPSPEPGALSTFGIVDATDRHWVHGHIADDVWIDLGWRGHPALGIFEMINQWLNTVCDRNPGHQPPLPIFVSSRESDLAWFTNSFRRAGLPPRFQRGDDSGPSAQRLLGTHDAIGYIHDQKQEGSS